MRPTRPPHRPTRTPSSVPTAFLFPPYLTFPIFCVSVSPSLCVLLCLTRPPSLYFLFTLHTRLLLLKTAVVCLLSVVFLYRARTSSLLPLCTCIHAPLFTCYFFPFCLHSRNECLSVLKQSVPSVVFSVKVVKKYAK